MPVNVSMREVTNTSVKVLWHRPVQPNGIIQGYRMYFMHQNFTDVRTVREPSEKMEFLLEGLGTSKYVILI
jgi:receptor-type tyrosine-protein phosphatase gamma